MARVQVGGKVVSTTITPSYCGDLVFTQRLVLPKSSLELEAQLSLVHLQGQRQQVLGTATVLLDPAHSRVTITLVNAEK